MQEREKLECRRGSISREEKSYILSKTHRKCAKCGKSLSVDSPDYTTDHFIPINKGGSNDCENLIPLCEECNKYKDDYVVSPDYFSYLDPHYEKEITVLFEKYCKEYRWTAFNNFAKEELIRFSYAVPIRSMQGYTKKGHIQGIWNEANLIKAKEKDLEDIYRLVQEYNQKYNWPSSYDEIKSIVDGIFKEGCIYLIKKKDELIGAVPIVIEPSERQGRQTYVFSLRGIPFRYQKKAYSFLFMHIFSYIFSELGDITDKMLLLDIVYPAGDYFINEIIDKYIPGDKYRADDSFCIRASLCFNKSKAGEVKIRDVRYISETLQKEFNLPPLEFKALTEEDCKKNKTEKAKEFTECE